MHTYKILIAYDGTHYSGWQIQPNGVSIQEKIEKALQVICQNELIRVIGSGRTDAGVHATGQTAHFKSLKEFDLRKTLYSLNGLLPIDIRIKSIEKVADDFHAQYSATGKEYHYYLHLEPIVDPFKRLYSWHVPQELDLALIRAGTRLFIGTYDFSSFANERHLGAAARNPVRTLYRLDCISIEGGVRLEFEGNGFLYKMVRNIMGTLLDLGRGKITLKDIEHIFAAKNRQKAPQAAPAQGLFLVRVYYDSGSTISSKLE